MKPPFFACVSIPVLSLIVLLPIWGLARSGWQPWGIIVWCVIAFGAASGFLASSSRLAFIGRGTGRPSALPKGSEPVRSEKRVTRRPDRAAGESQNLDCTVWDCF